MPCDGCEGAAHQEPEGGSPEGKRRRSFAAYSDGGISEAGKNTAHSKENTDGFPACDFKRMHIEAANNGGGRKEQPKNIYMEKMAHSFSRKAQKKNKGDCRSRQLCRVQPQVLFHGEIGKQHTLQENHKFHINNPSFRNF